MRARSVRMISMSLVLLLGASLLLSIPTLAGSQSIANDRRRTPERPAPLAASISIDLCAKAGTLSLPDSTLVDIWGFALKPTAVSCTDDSVAAQLPGPVLEVTAGDHLTITLHNALAENVSISFPGQNLMPDTVGAAPDGTVTYTFTAANPGTYLYESGTFGGTSSAIQVAMGLYGALIVRPSTPAQAYDTPDSAYDVEAVLVLSEIDPALHANPGAFNLLDYAPKYWLINGKAYPSIPSIPVKQWQRVLLRYLNAALSNHTMTLLGMHQRVIATDAYPLNYPYEAVALNTASGQTWDTIATIPAGTEVGSMFPLYNRNLYVTNAGSFPGGMTTFISVEPWPYILYLPAIMKNYSAP